MHDGITALHESLPARCHDIIYTVLVLNSLIIQYDGERQYNNVIKQAVFINLVLFIISIISY